MDLAELASKLNGAAEQLSATEGKIAWHIIEHPELWGFEATTSLANMLGVHRSTIVRFAQRIGYKGFPDLQEEIRAAYLQSVSSPSDLFSVSPGRDFNEVVHSVYDRELRNLRETYAKLDGLVLEKTARHLASARNVLVFGRRFSYSIAAHTSFLLRSLRPHVRLAPDPGGSSLDAVFDLGPDDAALMFSLRRHSPEVKRAMVHLVQHGVPTTLVTDAKPVSGLPKGVQILHAHIGSTSTLDSFTSLVSLSHAMATIVARLVDGSSARQALLEEARVYFQRP